MRALHEALPQGLDREWFRRTNTSPARMGALIDMIHQINLTKRNAALKAVGRRVDPGFGTSTTSPAFKERLLRLMGDPDDILRNRWFNPAAHYSGAIDLDKAERLRAQRGF